MAAFIRESASWWPYERFEGAKDLRGLFKPFSFLVKNVFKQAPKNEI